MRSGLRIGSVRIEDEHSSSQNVLCRLIGLSGSGMFHCQPVAIVLNSPEDFCNRRAPDL